MRSGNCCTICRWANPAIAFGSTTAASKNVVTFADSAAIERRLPAIDFTFEVAQGVNVAEDNFMALTVQ